jgi:hypothetical protein
MAVIGAKALKSCAPCVIVGLLDTEEITELRAALDSARAAAGDTIEIIDLHLSNELANREADVRYGQ